jgi:hypothetical protein
MGAAGMVKNVGEIIEYLKELRQNASLAISQ